MQKVPLKDVFANISKKSVDLHFQNGIKRPLKFSKSIETKGQVKLPQEEITANKSFFGERPPAQKIKDAGRYTVKNEREESTQFKQSKLNQ